MQNRLSTCKIDSCSGCKIADKTNCRFEPAQLLGFYLISLPAFVIGGAGIRMHSQAALYVWFAILIVFFLGIEIRVLCSHCPHYERSSFFLRCWANYGAPKLYKYRPGPMNVLEKAVLLTGFSLVWGYPAAFTALQKEWTLLALYSGLTIMFFILLRKNNCIRCVNFSCPLNRVDMSTKKIFLKNNPQIGSRWPRHYTD
jgi:succinate-acetate transporter protein